MENTLKSAFDMINSDVLTEDVKTQMTLIFESVVNEKISALTTKLEADYIEKEETLKEEFEQKEIELQEEFEKKEETLNEKYENELNELKNEMHSNIDNYSDYIVDNFIKEHSEKIQMAMDSNRAKAIIEGFSKLVQEFGFTLNEKALDFKVEKDALFEKLEKNNQENDKKIQFYIEKIESAKNDKSKEMVKKEKELEEKELELKSLKENIQELNKEKRILEHCSNFSSMVDAENFKNFAKNVKMDENFDKNLNILKENFKNSDISRLEDNSGGVPSNLLENKNSHKQEQEVIGDKYAKMIQKI